MYETRKQPLLRPKDFLRRVLGHLAAAAVLLLGSVALGMAGYMHFEHLARARRLPRHRDAARRHGARSTSR